jgi:hypothetical protein
MTTFTTGRKNPAKESNGVSSRRSLEEIDVGLVR